MLSDARSYLSSNPSICVYPGAKQLQLLYLSLTHRRWITRRSGCKDKNSEVRYMD